MTNNVKWSEENGKNILTVWWVMVWEEYIHTQKTIHLSDLSFVTETEPTEENALFSRGTDWCPWTTTQRQVD